MNEKVNVLAIVIFSFLVIWSLIPFVCSSVSIGYNIISFFIIVILFYSNSNNRDKYEHLKRNYDVLVHNLKNCHK